MAQLRLNNVAVWGLLTVLTAFVGCAPHNGGDYSVEELTDVYKPHYASGFAVSHPRSDSAITVVTVRDPWQNASGVEKQIAIERGKEPKRIIAMSSSHVAMLEALGVGDRIVGVSGKDFITSETLRSRFDSVADVGYDGNVNYERLAGLRPDIVLLYSVAGASPMEAKLTELGIKSMYIGDFIEESPLGKAEWIVALGEILGIDDKARNIFDDIATRYETLRDSIASFDLPVVKVMMNAPYGDSWLLPSAQSYAVRLLADAGAEPVKAADGSAPVAVGVEEALKLAQKADVWLAPGNCRSYSELAKTLPKFASVKPVVNHRVFSDKKRMNDSGGNDFWESAIVNPDLVLRDLVKIAHPELLPDYETYYYEPLR